MNDREEMLINICHINYFVRDNREVKIHCDYGIYNYDGTFKQLRESLSQDFIQTDRGNITNLNYINNVFVDELVLKDGMHVHVSKNGHKELFHHEIHNTIDIISDKVIVVKSEKDNVTINTDEIIYMERPYNDIIIHTKDNTYLCRDTLKKYELELLKDFIRIHKGYLINIKHIGYLAHENVKMSNGDELPISQRRRPKIRRKLDEFVL